MKSILSTLALAGTVLVGGFASAQTDPANLDVQATFYDGNPFSGGEEIESTTLSTGAVVSAFEDDTIDDAEFVTLDVGEGSLTFEIVSVGSSQTSTVLDLNGVDDASDDDAVMLSDVVEGIQMAIDGQTELAVFTEGTPDNGVATGFYRFNDGSNTGDNPIVRVNEADHFTVTYEGNVTTFETTAPGFRPLSDVRVMTDDGETLSLFRLSLRAMSSTN